jgi:hypothetical protein
VKTPERSLQCGPRELDRHRVLTSLGLADDQQPVQQLDPLILVEEALLDEPVVLDPGEPAGFGTGRSHGGSPYSSRSISLKRDPRATPAGPLARVHRVYTAQAERPPVRGPHEEAP